MSHFVGIIDNVHVCASSMKLLYVLVKHCRNCLFACPHVVFVCMSILSWCQHLSRHVFRVNSLRWAQHFNCHMLHSFIQHIYASNIIPKYIRHYTTVQKKYSWYTVMRVSVCDVGFYCLPGEHGECGQVGERGPLGLPGVQGRKGEF